MKHIKSPFLAAMIVSALVHTSSPAQITISQSHLELIFAVSQQTYVYTDTTDSVFQVNIGGPGGSHVYDFTSFQFSRVDTAPTMAIGVVPQLPPRYPSDAIAFRLTQDRETNEYEYFIYRFLDSAMYSPGEANLSPLFERYKQHVPEEFIFPYPMTFGYSTSYSITTYDTTYVGGVPSQIEMYSTNVTKDADGWGTVVLPGFGTFNCLRWREVELPPSQRKDFLFFTQEGYLLTIGTNNAEPDSGVVSADEIILFVPESVVGVQYWPELPRELALFQNYPNPFNPLTTIRFSLPKSTHVTLKIFNLLGQEIETLVNEKLSAGEYDTKWNAAGHPSGIYFYRLQAHDYREVRKLILLK